MARPVLRLPGNSPLQGMGFGANALAAFDSAGEDFQKNAISLKKARIDAATNAALQASYGGGADQKYGTADDLAGVGEDADMTQVLAQMTAGKEAQSLQGYRDKQGQLTDQQIEEAKYKNSAGYTSLQEGLIKAQTAREEEARKLSGINIQRTQAEIDEIARKNTAWGDFDQYITGIQGQAKEVTDKEMGALIENKKKQVGRELTDVELGAIRNTYDISLRSNEDALYQQALPTYMKQNSGNMQYLQGHPLAAQWLSGLEASQAARTQLATDALTEKQDFKDTVSKTANKASLIRWEGGKPVLRSKGEIEADKLPAGSVTDLLSSFALDPKANASDADVIWDHSNDKTTNLDGMNELLRVSGNSAWIVDEVLRDKKYGVKIDKDTGSADETWVDWPKAIRLAKSLRGRSARAAEALAGDTINSTPDTYKSILNKFNATGEGK